MNTLPKWQSIMLNNNNKNIHGDGHKLIFGFTPPTVALVALAIFLCILLEIMFSSSTRKPSSSSTTFSSTPDPVQLQVDRNSTAATLVDQKRTVLLMIKYWSTTTTTTTTHEPAVAAAAGHQYHPPVKVKVVDVSNCKKQQKRYWAFLMSDQGILVGFQEMICSFVLKGVLDFENGRVHHHHEANLMRVKYLPLN